MFVNNGSASDKLIKEVGVDEFIKQADADSTIGKKYGQDCQDAWRKYWAMFDQKRRQQAFAKQIKDNKEFVSRPCTQIGEADSVMANFELNNPTAFGDMIRAQVLKNML